MVAFASLFIFLPLLTNVYGFRCNESNCRDCVDSSSSCVWCRRDNKCYMSASVFNPCEIAENIVDQSHCGDKLSHYDPELSMKMLLLSSAAYDRAHPQECLDNALPSDKFQIHYNVTKKCDFFKNYCSGYVAISHELKVIALAFRGSKHFGQAFMVLMKSLTSPREKFLNGEVQTYWKRGFDQLWSGMEKEVKHLVSQNPSYQLWVTGHSLGGAMASLASTWLSYKRFAPRKNIILYTFGMPRVGNYDYALEHDELVNNSWRVVNDNDIVPHFPTVASFSILNGPYHHGVEAFYSKPATSPYSEHRECHGKPYNEDATCSFKKLRLSIKRHKTYFDIPVGTFWKTKCVRSTRKKSETSGTETDDNSSAKTFALSQSDGRKYLLASAKNAALSSGIHQSFQEMTCFIFLATVAAIIAV